MLLSFSHPPSIPATQTPPHGDCQDLLTILPVESSEIMYHSDILMMMMSEQEGGREGRVACLPAWFDSVGLPRDSLTGRKRSVVRWNGIKIAYVHIFPSLVPVCLSVVVTPPPRGLSFSLATQLICTNYSLLIEITLNQSIRGEWVWLLNNYIALRCNLFRMCRANWIFCQH